MQSLKHYASGESHEVKWLASLIYLVKHCSLHCFYIDFIFLFFSLFRTIACTVLHRDGSINPKLYYLPKNHKPLRFMQSILFYSLGYRKTNIKFKEMVYTDYPLDLPDFGVNNQKLS